MNQAEPSYGRMGCVTLLFSMLLAGVLLVLNGAMVVAAHAAMLGDNELLANRYVTQLIYFVVPLILLGLEWLLFDIVSDRLRRRD